MARWRDIDPKLLLDMVERTVGPRGHSFGAVAHLRFVYIVTCRAPSPGRMSMARWSPSCAMVAAAFLVGIAPAASRARPERRASSDRTCLALAGPDPLDLPRVAGAPPASDRVEAGPGREGPIAKEEVALLIRDLQRVPLRAGGWTIRAATERSLPPERLRQLVGDVRSVLAVQHGREVLAVVRSVPGADPREVEELEQSVSDIARCALDRIGGESAYERTLQAIGPRRAEVEAAVLGPLTPATKGSR
jgi:hypothetical protein